MPQYQPPASPRQPSARGGSAVVKQQQGQSVQNRVDTTGFGVENFPSLFLLHLHTGSGTDGGLLYGPYFIVDEADKKTYKLVAKNGVLGLQVVK